MPKNSKEPVKASDKMMHDKKEGASKTAATSAAKKTTDKPKHK